MILINHTICMQEMAVFLPLIAIASAIVFKDSQPSGKPRRSKGPARPAPWTAAWTYVTAVMELLGHVMMRPGSWNFSSVTSFEVISLVLC